MARKSQDFNEWLRSHGYEEESKPDTTTGNPPNIPKSGSDLCEEKEPFKPANSAFTASLILSPESFIESGLKDENVSIANNFLEEQGRSPESKYEHTFDGFTFKDPDKTHGVSAEAGIVRDERAPMADKHKKVLLLGLDRFEEPASQAVAIQRNIDLLRDKAELAVATRELEIKDFYLHRLKSQLNQWRVFRLLKAFLRWKSVIMRERVVMNLTMKTALSQLASLVLKQYFSEWRCKTRARNALQCCIAKAKVAQERREKLSSFARWARISAATCPPSSNAAALSSLRSTFQHTIDAQLNENKHLAARLMVSNFRMLFYRTVKPSFDKLRVSAKRQTDDSDTVRGKPLAPFQLALTMQGHRRQALSNMALSRAFRTWYQQTISGTLLMLKLKYLSGICQRFVQPTRTNELKTAFARLKRNGHLLQLAFDKLLTTIRQRTLREYLRRWSSEPKRHVNRLRTVRAICKVLGRCDKGMLLRSFSLWRRHCAVRRVKLCCNLSFYASRWVTSAKTKAFNSLRRYGNRKHGLHLAVHKLYRRTSKSLVRISLNKWKHRTALLQRVEHGLTTLQKKIEVLNVSGGFRKLVSNWQASTRKEALKNVLMARSFYLLIRNASHKSHRREAIARVLSRLVQCGRSTIREAFLRWKSWIYKQKLVAITLTNACEKTRVTSLRVALYTWKHATQTHIVQQLGARQIVRRMLGAKLHMKRVAFNLLVHHGYQKTAAANLCLLFKRYLLRLSLLQLANVLCPMQTDKTLHSDSSFGGQVVEKWKAVGGPANGEFESTHLSTSPGADLTTSLRRKASCFSVWKQCVVKKKMLKLSVQGILRRWEYDGLITKAAAWSRWTKRASQMRHLETTGARLSKLLSSHRLETSRRAFAQWRMCVAQARRLRSLGLQKVLVRQLFHTSTQSSLRYSFSRWRELSMRRTKLLNLLVTRLQNVARNRLDVCFSTWKHKHQARQYLKGMILAAHDSMRTRCLRDAWKTWASMCLKDRISERCFSLLSHELYHSNMVQESFKRWRSFVRHCVSNKRRLVQVLRTAENRSLAAAFRKWREEHRSQSVRRKLSVAVFIRNKMKHELHQGLASAVTKWKAYTKHAKLLESVVVKRWLRRRFRRWKFVVVQTRVAKQVLSRLQTITNKRDWFAKHKAFHRLKLSRIYKTVQSKAVRTLCKRLYTCKVSSAFYGWKSSLHKARLLQKCVERMQHRALCKGFAAWKQTADIRSSVEGGFKLQMLFVKRMTMWRRARLLHGWNVIAGNHARVGTMQRSVLVVTQTSKRIAQRRALVKWKSFSSTTQALQALETALQIGSLRHCFVMWRIKFVTVYHHLVKLNAWAYRNSEVHSLRVAFQRIKQFSYRRLKLSHGMTKLVYLLDHHYTMGMRMVFRRLRSATLARKVLGQIGRRRKKERLREAFLIWRMRAPRLTKELVESEPLRVPGLLRVAFMAWRNRTDRSVGRKQAIAVFARMVHNKIRRKRLHAVLYKWKVVTHLGRQMQQKLGRVFLRLTSGVIRCAFLRLKTHALHAHKRRSELTTAFNSAHDTLLRLQAANVNTNHKRRAFAMLQNWQRRCVKLQDALLRWNRRKGVRSAFRTWKKSVEWMSGLERLIIRVQVRNSFARWKFLTVVKSRGLERLRSRLSFVSKEMNAALKLAFVCLKHQAEHVRRQQNSIRIVQLMSRNVAQTRLRTAFTCWKAANSRAAKVETGLVHISRLLRRKRRDASLYAVRKLADYSVVVQSSTRKVQGWVKRRWLLKWNMRLVLCRKGSKVNRILEKVMKAQSFRKLCDHDLELSLRESIVLRTTMRRRLARHFYGWRRRVGTNSVENRAVLLVERLEKRIPMWHKRVVFHRLEQHAVVQRTVSMTQNCRRKYRLGTAFYMWKEAHLLKVTTLARKEQGVLSKYYRKWHIAIERRRQKAERTAMEYQFRERVGKCLATVRDHQKTLHMSSLFAEWKQETVAQRQRKVALTRAVALIAKRKKRIVLFTLKRNFIDAALRDACAKALVRGLSLKRRKLLRQVMDMLYVSYREQTLRQTAIRKLCSLSRTHVLRTSFVKWERWKEEAVLLDKLLGRMLVLFNKCELRCGLQRFRRTCALRHVSSVLVEKDSRDLQFALTAWSLRHRLNQARGSTESNLKRLENAKKCVIRTRTNARERGLLQMSWSRLKAYTHKLSLSRTVARQLSITQVVIHQRVSYRRQARAFRVWSAKSRGNKYKSFANTLATLLITQHHKCRQKFVKQCFVAWRRQAISANVKAKLDYSLCETLVQRCICKWLRRVDSLRFRVVRSFNIWKNAYERSMVDVYKRVSENLSLTIAEKEHGRNEKLAQLETHNTELLAQTARLEDTISQEQQTYAAASMKVQCLQSELEQKEEVLQRLRQENEAFKEEIKEDRESLSLSQLRIVRVEKENVLMQYQVNALEKELAEAQQDDPVKEDNPGLASLRAGMEIDLETLEGSSSQDASFEDSTTMRAYCEQIELRCFQALGQLREATSLLKQKDRLIAKLQEDVGNCE